MASGDVGSTIGLQKKRDDDTIAVYSQLSWFIPKFYDPSRTQQSPRPGLAKERRQLSVHHLIDHHPCSL